MGVRFPMAALYLAGGRPLLSSVRLTVADLRGLPTCSCSTHDLNRSANSANALNLAAL
jgi:hypothetical protein